jgi:serine protease Do
MSAKKTGFFLGAIAGAGIAAAAMAGLGVRLSAARAETPQPVLIPTAGAPIFAPPPGAPLSFADIFDRVSPAVVSINVKATVDRRTLEGIPGFEDQPPARPRTQPRTQPRGQGEGSDEQDGQDGQEDPNSTQAMASGSGFFISSDGYIVTNNHVIENAKDIKVVLKDESELPAKVIGHDEGTDLAVIKVEGSKFPYVNFENSGRPRVGDWVLAVGNPFGLGGTATAGIISSYGRDIGEKFVDYIQIDAPINKGNSGGPTFDIYGRVIGVNTAIFSPSGGSVGIGFAIPADVAEGITKQLMSGGQITRGYLGATIQDVSADIADSLGRPGLKGALVDELVPGGPAEKAGLQSGDVVLSINNVAVHSGTELTRQVAASHSGDTMRLSILRGGQPRQLEVRSGVRPSEAELAKVQGGLGGNGDQGSESKPALRPGALGMSLGPLDAAARRRYSVPAEVKGAVIEDLTPTSDAAMKGLKQGDVVVSVNNKPVAGAADLAAEVDAAKKAGRTAVLLFIYRDHHQQAVPIKIEPDKGESAPPPSRVRPRPNSQ